MKKALISGITGQDGSFLAEFLLQKGYEVHGILRRSSSFNTGRIEHLYFDEWVRDMKQKRTINLHYGDMTDSSSLIRIIQQVQPDEIYNLAAQSHVKVSFDVPEYTAETDAIGTLRMLEAVRILGLEKKTRIYQASTSELFGKVQEVPQKETMGGVALSRLGYMGEVALSVAAIIGALSVMALIVYVSQKVKGNVTLLIIGVMIGYVASAVIGVLKYFSVEEDIRAYVIWGLGSFARVSGDQMLLFVCIMAVLLPLSFLLIKTMNLLLLGDGYARNLGLNIKRARLLVISCSGVLVAIVTAYCGPIMFIGLAVPHLCRAIFHTSDHRILMPATLLVGAALALVCNLIARMPGFEGALPVNSVTALVGAPVVASVLFRKRKGELNE